MIIVLGLGIPETIYVGEGSVGIVLNGPRGPLIQRMTRNKKTVGPRGYLSG